METPFLLFLGDIGGSEMLLIMVVILIFFGANKIPELARGLGRGIREFKDASREIRSEIESAAPPVQPPQPVQPSYSQPTFQQPPTEHPYHQPAPTLDQPQPEAPAQPSPVPAPEQPTVTPAGLPSTHPHSSHPTT